MRRTAPVVLLALFLAGAPLFAQRARTIDAADVPDRPLATLEDAAWLEGDWRGTGLGADVQDIWTAPMGGAMLGASRVVRGGAVVFYEILTLVEKNGSLLLRLKHFHPDLKGWEARDETREFRLVGLSDEELWFDGMTFRRLGADSIEVWVAIGAKDGSVREEHFLFERASP